MQLLLDWVYFAADLFVTSAATLLIGSRSGRWGRAVGRGTLSGVAASWILRAFYWFDAGPNYCDLCYPDRAVEARSAGQGGLYRVTQGPLPQETRP